MGARSRPLRECVITPETPVTGDRAGLAGAVHNCFIARHRVRRERRWQQSRDSRQDVTGLLVNRNINIRREYRHTVRAMVQRLFKAANVEFVIVGGVAAAAHGSVRGTQDLDVVYRRSEQTFHRIAEALAPWEPYLRGAPPGLPFRIDANA